MNLRQLIGFSCIRPRHRPAAKAEKEKKPEKEADMALPKSGVVVPLYIYPLTPETWTPLYAAIEDNPALDFLVIVNPNSGPGDLPSPDANYAREVARLNSYANVYTVGYIRIDYCRKPLHDAYSEIERYASWDGQSDQLGLRGIFVDETPNHYSDERARYLQSLHDFIKHCDGIRPDRFVVHNPGTPPDATLADPVDLIIISEEPYSRYQSQEVQQRLRELPHDRARSGYLIHSVPSAELHSLVHDLRHRGVYLFVTEISGDFYERFGPRSWGEFLRALQ